MRLLLGSGWLAACFLSQLLVLPFCAYGYSRPDALSLAAEQGAGWEVLPTQPLVELVKDRTAKPDFPRLAPQLADVIPPEIQEGAPLPKGTWQPAAVPAAWELALGVDYNSAGWYRRELHIPRDWLAGTGSRVWLEFDAVATVAGVWVNGQWCGGNVGDYVRWRVEITAALPAGEADAPTRSSARPVTAGMWGEGRQAPAAPAAGHDAVTASLLVYVDELPGHVTQGFPSMIGPHHGGIWQECRLYRSRETSVPPDGLEIKTHATARRVEVTCQVDGEFERAGAGIAVQLRRPDGSWHDAYASQDDPGFSFVRDVPGGVLRCSFNLPESSFALWQPTSPNLYQLTFALGDNAGNSDRVQARFAFRTVAVDGYRFRLNGLPLYLRSALNWGWYPGKIAPLPDAATLREEFRQIKALGFNAETVCLLVMPDYYYDIADEEGILLWQEYPAWHNEVTPALQEEYLRLYDCFYRRDMNRPSVILRSLACENGEMDAGVIAQLLALGRRLTDEPLQDNTSWLWMSKPELTDWYDEHNYYNNHQWVKYTLETLPGKLNELPDKPFLIGESILFNTWPDTAALVSSLGKSPGRSGASPEASNGASGGSATKWPYWFPSCFNAVLATEDALRARYNASLPRGPQQRPVDIVADYLLPQSYDYALHNRRFQIELLHASPRYAGYTINVVRDMPLIRAGLLDDLGQPRWTEQDWAWHGEQTQSKVQIDSRGNPWKGDRTALLAWDSAWDAEIERSAPVLVYRSTGDLRAAGLAEPGDGAAGTATAQSYRDFAPWLVGWDGAQPVAPGGLAGVDPAMGHSPVVVTSVLTTELADFAQRGGVVVVCASKWPGALGSYSHFFWRDSIFVPPVGPWAEGSGAEVPAGQRITDRVVRLQGYDLTQSFGEVMPVEELGIADSVDPLLRLYDTHDLSTVVTYDQLFAAKAGRGLVIASSLDHGTPAGQWVLSKLLGWGLVWKLRELRGEGNSFPQRELSAEQLDKLAVARANGILDINAAWRFSLDPEQQGESAGWTAPGFDDSGWENVPTGKSWEALGHNVNGMGWYRLQVDIPADWASGKIKLVAEGVDDAYTVWVNGRKVQTHGSFTVHEQTVWQQQTVTDITQWLKPGEDNLLVLQVVDITGQGGVYKPVYLAVE